MAATTQVQLLIDAKNNATAALRQAGKQITDLQKKSRNLAIKGFGELKSAGQAMAFGLKTAFFGLAAGLGILTVAIGAVGGALTKSTIDMEQARIAFETMLGSAEEAGVLLEKIADFGAKTPFELPELVESSKKLLAYGETADNIIPIMQMLGDISAGVGKEKLPFLITALGQTRAKTVLAGGELKQFTETGIPLIEKLAEITGYSTTEIASDTKRLGISYDTVLEALGNMTEEGGDFHRAMIRQSSTLGGVLSNLADSFGIVGRAILGMNKKGEVREGSIFWHLREQAARLAEFLANNEGQIIGFFDKVFGKIGEVGGKVAAFLSPAVEALKNLGKTIWENRTIIIEFIEGDISRFIEVLSQIWTFIQPAVNAFIEWAKQGNNLKNLLTGVFTAIGVALTVALAAFIAAKATIIAIFTAIIAVVTFVRTAWTENWGGIRDKTQEAITAIVGFWNNDLKPTIDFIAQKWKENKDKTNATWEVIKTIIGTTIKLIAQIIKTVISVIGNTIKLYLAIIRGDWSAAWEAIKGIAISVWDLIKAIIGSAVAWILEIIKQYIANWKATFSRNLNAMLSIAKAIWNGIKNTISSAVDGVVNFLSNAWEGIKKTAEKAWNGLVSSITSIFDGIKNPIEKTINTITGWISNLMEKIRGAKEEGSSVQNNQFGGAVQAGRPTIVGENGPEMFIPSQSGNIRNQQQLGQNGGMGGNTINITVNAQTGASAQGIADEIRQLFRQDQQLAGLGINTR
jgi:tape measure domain-containing protein